MSDSITIPTIPADWVCHSNLEIKPGWLPSCLCVHKASEGSYHPFVIHRACVQNGRWEYHHGSYYFTEKEAVDAFNKKLAGA